MSSEETPRHPELPESVLYSPSESTSRSVSVGGRLAQFFYGGIPILAFLLLTGFVIPLMLFCCYDYRDYILKFEKVAETGKITSCEDANFSLNDYPVYQVTFEMPSQTETPSHAETPSYTEMPTVYSLQKLQSGNACALERCQSIFFGTIYRPVGTSLGKCGKSWLFLVITSGPCIALSLITIIFLKVQLTDAFANLRVLRYGKPIRVQETERHDTGRYARYRSIYRIVFRGFWENGTPYEYVRETSETDIFDERKEHWLLVHQEDVLFFEEILKMYRITENGKFRLKFGVIVRFLLLIILVISFFFPLKALDVLKSVSDFLYS